MQTEGMIALSAAAAGIAMAGVVSALRGAGDRDARLYLVAVFALFAGVVSIPIVVAFARPLYVFYMPAVLTMLLALPPMIYHYAASRTAELRPRRVHWRDGVLPVAGLIVTVGYWLLPATSKAAMFVDGELPPGFAPSALAFATFFLIFCWSLASFGYLAATFRRLSAFRTRLKNIYSNTDRRELRWIDWLMAFFVALWGASTLSLVSDNFGPGLPFPGEIVFALAIAVLLFLIAFSSIEPPAKEMETTPSSAPTDEEPVGKYARSALSADHAEQIAERIETAMRDDALFLDANLSLQKLSRHVSAPSNLVSQTLNEKLGSTFFDYIAHWRIEAAKPLIASSEASILSIALDVGFNSRSTFYKAFKRETGVTPKAFREAAAPPHS